MVWESILTLSILSLLLLNLREHLYYEEHKA